MRFFVEQLLLERERVLRVANLYRAKLFIILLFFIHKNIIPYYHKSLM